MIEIVYFYGASHVAKVQCACSEVTHYVTNKSRTAPEWRDQLCYKCQAPHFNISDIFIVMNKKTRLYCEDVVNETLKEEHIFIGEDTVFDYDMDDRCSGNNDWR